MMNRSNKIISALCALMCFSLFCATAQDAAAPDGGVAASVSSDAAAGGFDETAPFVAAQAAEEAEVTGGALNTVGVFLRMILVLAFVIACIYGFVWFMRKSVIRSNNADQFLRVVSQVTLAPGKSVQIVSLLDEKAYMLGVSDNSVNVIAEIENKETISAMNLYADKMARTSKPKTFEDILNIFMPSGAKGEKPLHGKGAAFDSTAAADMLRRTREGINRRQESGDSEDTGVEQ